MNKTVFLFSFLHLLVINLGFSQQDNGFKKIFNGKDLDGWYLKLKSGDEELAKKVYAVEKGTVHVFNDSFPDQYELNGDNATHGLFYTRKKYSKFILTFEYKWGDRVANNFQRWQYDAGCYYHVVDDKIWPVGIEYQIRYDHTQSQNHTGDFWVSKKPITWYGDQESRYLPAEKGGIKAPKKGEVLAANPKKFNALNGKWNKCEVIVMGDEYAIHKLNGEIVNVGTDLPFSEGVIGFQSETAEIFYRNIKIREFEEVIPMEKWL
ncbi:MAG: DUF1080 domain-containing protein [Bacteroidota bacterium]